MAIKYKTTKKRIPLRRRNKDEIDKETFYYRGSTIKDGFIKSILLNKARKTSPTKRDIILLEVQNVRGELITIGVTPEEAILISNALLSAHTEWNCREKNKKYKKRIKK